MGYYKMSYVYYFVPHTLLSGLMFYYFSKDYYYLRSRNFYYFTSFSYVYLVIAWCGVPLFISFIPELMILVSFFKFSFFSFLIYFLNFVLFFLAFSLILCNKKKVSIKARNLLILFITIKFFTLVFESFLILDLFIKFISLLTLLIFLEFYLVLTKRPLNFFILYRRFIKLNSIALIRGLRV